MSRSGAAFTRPTPPQVLPPHVLRPDRRQGAPILPVHLRKMRRRRPWIRGARVVRQAVRRPSPFGRRGAATSI